MVCDTKHVSSTKVETLTSLLMLCKRCNGDGCSLQGNVGGLFRYIQSLIERGVDEGCLGQSVATDHL